MTTRKTMHRLHDRELSASLTSLHASLADARIPPNVREVLEAKWGPALERIRSVDAKAAKYDAALQKTRERKGRLAKKRNGAPPSDAGP